MGVDEADDVIEFGGFRVMPEVGYEWGKWFATSFENAVRWGRACQRFPQPQPFHVAAVRLPLALLDEFEFHARWDGIGPAYDVDRDLLPELNRLGEVVITTAVDPYTPYDPE